MHNCSICHYNHHILNVKFFFEKKVIQNENNGCQTFLSLNGKTFFWGEKKGNL